MESQTTTTPRRRRRQREATPPEALIERIAAIRHRAAGSDAERRAANLLANELRNQGRTAQSKPLWVRCEWHAALVLAMALALAGSLLCVTQPEAGLAITAVALAGFLLDMGGRVNGFRWLTPKRATQNVVSPAPTDAPIRLVLTAATDAPRGGSYRLVDAWCGGRIAFPIVLSMVVIGVAAGLRTGDDQTWMGVMQIPPTIFLLGLIAAAIESRRLAPWDGSNAASAPALVLALAKKLDANPPRNLSVEVVLAGAGDSGGAQGLQHHMRTLKKQGLGRTDVAVLHFEPCANGVPCWWTRDGLLQSLDLHPQMVRLAQDIANDESYLGAFGYHGRGATGALAARRARFPALALGTWVKRDPGSVETDPASFKNSLAYAQALISRLDAELDEHTSNP